MTVSTKWPVCPMKIDHPRQIRPVLTGSSLCAWRFGYLATHRVYGEDWSDWALLIRLGKYPGSSEFSGCTGLFVLLCSFSHIPFSYPSTLNGELQPCLESNQSHIYSCYQQGMPLLIHFCGVLGIHHMTHKISVIESKSNKFLCHPVHLIHDQT